MSSTVVSGLQTLSRSSLPGIAEEALLMDENCKHRAVEHVVQHQGARYTPAPVSQLCANAHFRLLLTMIENLEKKILCISKY